MKKIVYPLIVFCLITTCHCCKTTKKNLKGGQYPLIGTQWELVAIDGKEITKEFALRPFITFDSAGSIHGNLGCNSFFGTYEAGKKGKMKIEYQGATKRLCSKMEVERQLINALKTNITRYQISGNQLTLFTDEKEIMRFDGVDLSSVE